MNLFCTVHDLHAIKQRNDFEYRQLLVYESHDWLSLQTIPRNNTYGSVAHPNAVDPDAGGCVHHVAGAQFGFDRWVEDGLLFLQVQNEPQLRQWKAGGPSQAEQRVVEVHSVTA